LNTQLRILKDYISFRIIQLIGFENPDKNLKQCLALFKDNQEIRDRISLGLIPVIQKVILAYLLNSQILLNNPNIKARLFELLCSSKKDLLYLEELFIESRISDSFDQFISGALFTFPYDLDSEIIPFKASNMSDSVNIKPQIAKFAPKITNLPQNYLEFNNKFLRMKCSLCKEYSKHLLTCVCMICGEALCAVSCDTKPKVHGNLNRHSKKFHMGTGIFLDFQQFFRSIVKTPLNTIQTGKDVYIDKLGQSIYDQMTTHRNVVTLDFKKFVLNPEFIQEMKGIIKDQNIGKEFFRVSVLSGNLYTNEYL